MSKFVVQIVLGLFLLMMTCFQGGLALPAGNHRNSTKFTISFEDCGRFYSNYNYN